MVNKLTNTVKPLDEVDKINEIIDALDDKQDTLVSGTNIKTINSNSILGSGNLTLDGLPSQTGNANKFLTTDGTDASWAAVPTRNIGEIVESTIPLTDAGLHLLDGALIQGSGIYSAFVTYIAGLVSTHPDLFTTEANWQTAVTTYGACGKFVYDNVNNTVRLPKYGNQIYTKGITSNAPVITGDSSTYHKSSYAMYFGDVNSSTPIINGSTYALALTAGSGDIRYSSSTTSVGSQPQVVPINLITDLANITTAVEGYYYIVLATSTKTDIEVDIDEVVTDLNGKADVDLTNVPSSKGILTESYVNGTSWYRVYSDGWCEQGGVSQSAGDQTTNTISLLKNYTDTNYYILFAQNAGVEGPYTNGCTAKNKTTNSFALVYRTGGTASFYWQACGYIS